MPDLDIVNFDRLVAEPLDLKDGTYRISSKPGHGLTLDAEAVRRHLRIDSHEGAPLPGELS
jgi:L-alanine-DL-glutamate epimerase-like enolase superfamily enzyme